MLTRRHIGWWSFLALWFSFQWPSGVQGRVAGKIGHGGNYYSGKSYSGINDELIFVSIAMGVIIIVLITIALCYIAHEKCKKKPEIYITA